MRSRNVNHHEYLAAAEMITSLDIIIIIIIIIINLGLKVQQNT